MFYITAWTTYGPNQRRDHRSPQAADVRPSLSPRLGCGDHAENVCRPCDGPSLEDTDGIGVYSRRRRSHGGLTSSRRSGGFDKGRWPVRCLAIGLPSGLPSLARKGAIARVPLSNPPRPWNRYERVWKPVRCSAGSDCVVFRPRPNWPPRLGSASVAACPGPPGGRAGRLAEPDAEHGLQ